MAVTATRDDSSTFPEEVQAGAEPTACLSSSGFRVYEVGGFPVGDLSITGEIREHAVRLALRCLQAVPLVEGVFVYLQTQGGSAWGGDAIRAVLGEVRKAVPVVALVARAQSAGMGILPACSRVLADGAGAILGCEGIAAHFCDGRVPQVIVSAQTPQKWPDPPPVGPDHFVRYDKTFLEYTRADFDARYERNIADIATARRVPAESLRPILDGRTFLARTALEYGLIDGFGDEAEALKQLVRLIHQKKERKKAWIKRRKSGRSSSIHQLC